MDHEYSGEMCERFYVYYRFEVKKTIGSLKINTTNNVITLLFYSLTWASTSYIIQIITQFNM